MNVKRLGWLPAIVAVLLCAGALLSSRPAPPMGLDLSAQPILEKGPTEAELSAALQAQAEESRVRFRISTEPIFSLESGDASLNIFNSVENTQSMYVTVTLDATGEELYRSRELPPGGWVLRDKLSVELAVGQYPATAVIHVLDPATGRESGAPEVKLTLTVQT